MGLKAGIFLDIQNLTRNGGWGLRYDVMKRLAEAQGTVVLRANAYVSADLEREKENPELRSVRESYREAIRRSGYHVRIKPVKRYRDEDGEWVVKANADLDLAVDALLQSENLDYILLGSGDGDFLELVRALQNRGKRVDVVSFAYQNTSRELREAADHYFHGVLVPGLLPAASDDSDQNRMRGELYSVEREKGYGFLRARVGLEADQVIDNVFLHISEVSNSEGALNKSEFAQLKGRRAVLEFTLEAQADGRNKAVRAVEFQPS